MTDDLTMERSFEAPVDLLWRMWTDPVHFKQWYGPDGATIAVASFDVRVGGARLVGMEVQTPNGEMRMWFAGEHLEVVENERLVYTESVSDEHGTVASDGHEMTEVAVELAAVGAGTRMVLTHRGIPAGSPGAMGWSMALDKLVSHVHAVSRSA
jgi:uncharacterized protein YndB with AHSA1/START domain